VLGPWAVAGVRLAVKKDELFFQILEKKKEKKL